MLELQNDDSLVGLLRQMIEESREKDQEILDRIDDVHTVVKDLSNDFEQHTEEEADAREQTTRRVEVLETAFINSGRPNT